MRDGWVETKLGHYIHINTGKLDVNAASEFGDYPFFTCSRETYRIDEAAFEGESVLVAGNGDLNVKYYDGKFNAYQRTYVLNSVDKKTLDNRFLFLFMQTYIEYLRSETRGTVIQYLKKGQFTDAKIKLPPLPEQKRIVDLIASVDSYIEVLQQQLESAKRSRNAVLHELLTAGGDDWVETTLGDITDLVRGPFGGSLKKEIFVQEGFAVYEQQHAIYGDFSTIRYRISSEKFDEMKRFSLVPGDLIMSCSGTMGKVRIVPKEADPGIINQALLKIKPKSNLSSDFLYLCMQSDDFIRQIEMNSGGGALQNVSSVKMLKGIKLRVPGLLEQERVIGIISMIDEVIMKTELAICEAKNLRSGLLSELLAGKHEIPASYDKVIGAA